MTPNMLLLPILLPVLIASICLALPSRIRIIRRALRETSSSWVTITIVRPARLRRAKRSRISRWVTESRLTQRTESPSAMLTLWGTNAVPGRTAEAVRWYRSLVAQIPGATVEDVAIVR